MEEYIVALQDRKQVAEDTMAFWFHVSGAGYTFRAGQNAAFTLLDPPETDAAGNIRTLSIASSPNDHTSLMVAMRMRNSAFKNSLRMLPLGTNLRARTSWRLALEGADKDLFHPRGEHLRCALSA